MSRLRRIADRDRIFFITSNLLPQVPPFSPTERDLLLLNLDALRKQSALRLLGYVIMPDHVHLLLATDVDSISNLMHQWKFKTGFAIQRLRGKKGPLWQARYFDFICRRTRDVSSKLDYIRQNPVAAGLVAEPHSWRWSSVGFYSQSTVPPYCRITSTSPAIQTNFSGPPLGAPCSSPFTCSSPLQG